jgi:hypothetical protein
MFNAPEAKMRAHTSHTPASRLKQYQYHESAHCLISRDRIHIAAINLVLSGISRGTKLRGYDQAFLQVSNYVALNLDMESGRQLTAT